MSDYRFMPNELFGVAERQLTIRLTNEGTTDHNFSVDATPIDVTVEPGQSKTVIFLTPASVEAVNFFCRLHGDRGMSGVIRVSGPATTTSGPSRRRNATSSVVS